MSTLRPTYLIMSLKKTSNTDIWINLGFLKVIIYFKNRGLWHYFHILWSKGNKLQGMGKIQFLKILIFDNLIIFILVKNSDS